MCLLPLIRGLYSEMYSGDGTGHSGHQLVVTELNYCSKAAQDYIRVSGLDRMAFTLIQVL